MECIVLVAVPTFDITVDVPKFSIVHAMCDDVCFEGGVGRQVSIGVSKAVQYK